MKQEKTKEKPFEREKEVTNRGTREEKENHTNNDGKKERGKIRDPNPQKKTSQGNWTNIKTKKEKTSPEGGTQPTGFQGQKNSGFLTPAVKKKNNKNTLSRNMKGVRAPGLW